MKWDCIIVGAGIVGVTTAYEYLMAFPEARILLIEKEKKIFTHQSGKNSGVIHSGIYYKPGSYKAKNCIKGYKKLIEFSRKNNVPYKITGKLIVATKKNQLESLSKLYEYGIENGLKGIKLLDKKDALKIEPFCENLIKALYVPQSGIINYKEVGNKILQNYLDKGGKITLNTSLKKVVRGEAKILVDTDKENYETNKIILCLGVSADKFLRNSLKSKYRIFPFKGEYFYLNSSAIKYVNGLIYPVPDLNFPFLGVHLTKTIDNQVEAGPNAVLSLSRYGYGKLSFNFSDFSRIIFWKGFWIFAFKFWKIGFYEIYRSFSKKEFTKSLQNLLPKIKKEDLIKGKSGIRAQIMTEKGGLLDDFLIDSDRGIFNIVNAPSPAATSAFAIANEIIDYIKNNEFDR